MIPKKITIIGGSTVYGEGDPEGGGFVSHLKRWHESTNGIGSYVFNLGISGNIVADMLSRSVTEAKIRNSDLIVVYPGLNDTRHIGSREATNFTEFNKVKLQLRELTQNLMSVAPVILMSAVPLDESRTTPFRGNNYFLYSDAKTMTNLIAKTAEETEAKYLGIFELWQNRSNMSELLADGLHCNAQGHEQLFQETKSFINGHFGGNITR